MSARRYRKLILRGLLWAAPTLTLLSSARGLAMPLPAVDSPLHKVIVIGFVGGFVRHDDAKHAEVKFAARLRDRYASAIDVDVFSNYSGRKALHYALHLLDTNGDGILSETEREQARIVIFGHSWGGTQTILLARALERRHIPVLLTIQIDTVFKPGVVNFSVPGNVARAINFYQSGGLLHGRSEIRAADPKHTEIVGSFHMSYKEHPVNCDEFHWYTRVVTKSHIEIENDPRVWAEAATLIDAELSDAGPIAPGAIRTSAPIAQNVTVLAP